MVADLEVILFGFRTRLVPLNARVTRTILALLSVCEALDIVGDSSLLLRISR